MQIQVVYREPPTPTPLASLMGAGKFSSYVGGAFGYVRKQRIKESCVEVELVNGIILHSVRVPSRSWVDETAPTVTGTVDLPPINSFVFVMFPYGIENTSGAMVLFSVMDDANKKHSTRLQEGDEKKIVEVLGGNMKTTYDRETGDYLVEDIDDAKLKISVSKANKTIEIFDWNDNKITASSAGIKLEGKGNTLSLENGKVLVNNHLEIGQ